MVLPAMRSIVRRPCGRASSVALVSLVLNILVVTPPLPVSTFADVIASAKAAPDGIDMASSLRDQITRFVKNGSVISATDGSLSSEMTTVTNSFLQFQQCQRFWNSCALTRSCHSRWTNSEPH